MTPTPEPDPDGDNPDGGDDDPDDGDDGGDTGARTSLSSMTKAQLVEYAEEHGITGADVSMKKADLISLIEEA